MPAEAGPPPPPAVVHHLAGVRIDTAFPGGNLLVDEIAPDGAILVRQDQRGSAQRWIHWSCRIQGPAGQLVRLRFTDGDVVGVRGPALSADDRTWNWQYAVPVRAGRECAFTLPDDGRPLRVAASIPHQFADWKAFCARLPALRQDTLGRSRGGRAVPLARSGGGPEAPALVLVAARHHSCEALAGWVLQGFAAETCADPRWRTTATCVFVPFADADGVEEGDQGKGRLPRDHGRDYLGDSLYPETAAIRTGFPAWSGGRPHVVIDLHCPWLAGEWNQHIYQVGAEDPSTWAEQQRLGRLLAAAGPTGLPYDAERNLPFGTAWNTGKATGGMGLRRWAGLQPRSLLATAFEIPYADVAGQPTSAESAEIFGRALARAVLRFLSG